MEKISLQEIISEIGGTLLKGSAALNLSNISIDSRTLRPGDTYLALKGAKHDGNDFIEAAINKGAWGLIFEKEPVEADLEKVSFALVVDNGLAALQGIAGIYRRKFDLPVVAVTGSNGKTTTKEMIGKILTRRFPTLVTTGNFNNQVGLPLTLLRLNRKHRAAVVELGTSGLGEIRTLARLARPDIGVITCIGHSHLQELKSLANVLKAKTELIDNLGHPGIAVLNSDDLYLKKVFNKYKRNLITFGIRNKAQVSAADIRLLPEQNCIYFNLKYRGRKQKIKLPAAGEHNVYNALAAASVALALRIPLRDIAAGLAKFKPVIGRMRIVKQNGLVIIDDAYNANPDSVKAALNTLYDLGCRRRKIAVLGDMLELGEISVEKHRQIGKIIGQLGVDMLYTIGPQSRFLALEAQERGLHQEKISIFNLGQEDILVAELKSFLRPGDVVLVKASHGLHLEKVVEELTKKG